MANLRLFIAGHVIGLTEPERAANRAIFGDVEDLFVSMGWDVVNPVNLMDDQSDPKDVMCKYFRMMMDCGYYYEFPDYMEHEECHAASLLAIAMHITPCREKWALTRKVRNLANIITSVTEIQFDKYSSFDNRTRQRDIIFARTIFIKLCRDIIELNDEEIAFFLKRDYDKAMEQLFRNADYNFREYFGREDAKNDELKSEQRMFRIWYRDVKTKLQKTNNTL